MALEWRSWRFTPGGDRRFYAYVLKHNGTPMVDDALTLAGDCGVRVTLDGNDLALEADAPPTPRLLAVIGRRKRDIVAMLCQREAEERRAIVGGSTTTSHRHRPASAPFPATGRDQRTLSFSCSSETIGARCTAHVTRDGWLSERARRVARCDFNGLLMKGPRFEESGS